MICDVLWCHTTAEGAAMVWAALLAFIPALLTIGAAIVIGLRQSAITAEQTRIQGRQAEIAGEAVKIEDLKVRADLFDKRMEVYDAAQAFIRIIYQDGAPPISKRTGSQAERDRQMGISRDFSEAMERSRYLFGEDIRTRLWEDIWKAANQLHFHLVSQENPQAGDEVDHAQKVLDLQLHFAGYDLDAILGPQLRLY